MPVETRLLDGADAPVYRRFMLEAYADTPDAFTSTVQERASAPLEWWARRLNDPLGRVWGAWADGELVGTVSLSCNARPKTRHKGQLQAMAVAAPWRGRGVGYALVQHLLHSARATLGLQMVALTVTEGNAAALALYARCGFVAFGTEPLAIRTDQGYRAKVHMCAVLGPAD